MLHIFQNKSCYLHLKTVQQSIITMNLFSVLSVDSEAPIIRNCPNSDTYSVSPGTPSTPVIWIEPTAFDNSGEQPAVSKSHEPGDIFVVGATPVTYTFTDSSGNQAMCSFIVTGNYLNIF